MTARSCGIARFVLAGGVLALAIGSFGCSTSQDSLNDATNDSREVFLINPLQSHMAGATNTAPVFLRRLPGSMTFYVSEPVRYRIAASDSESSTLTYRISGLPAGASYAATTGAFAWTPALRDTGSYPARFTVSDGVDSAVMQVAMTVVMPTLPSGIPLGILRPTAGDAYVYGDTVTVAVVSSVCANEVAISIQRGTRGDECILTNDAEHWLTLNGEWTTGSTNHFVRYYTSFAAQGVNIGFYKLALQDIAGCIDLGGGVRRVDDVLIKAWDPYGTEWCEGLTGMNLLIGYFTNGTFSVGPIEDVHVLDRMGGGLR